jgi:glycosyltransferase involved in cell wall biosynthesis
VIIEAQACGVVVLGSDSGEIPHVVADRERIFREGDIDGMARVIELWRERLVSPAERERARAQEAAKAASTYSDEVLAKRFRSALVALLREQRDASRAQGRALIWPDDNVPSGARSWPD